MGSISTNFGGTTTASYWDTETSGRTTSAGGEGKTTSELQSPTGYTGIYADWNVDLNGDGTGDDPWDFGTSRQHPALKGLTDERRRPGAPTIVAVAPQPPSGLLGVAWTAPSSDGGWVIRSYDLRYIETSADETDDSNWTVVDDVADAYGESPFTYILTGLTGGTQYDLQVRAANGPWSATATGTPTSNACVTKGAVADATNTGLASDCEALLAWRDTLAGTATLNWAADTPIADWDGIGDDSLEGSPTRVTRLYLNGLRLDGVIPSELSNLSALKVLWLHDNELTGDIPSSLGDLSNLTDLYAHNNDLTGEIPTELGKLTSLQELSLYSNDLSGSIPAELGKLTSLTSLSLHDNDLTGEIPAELGKLSSLKSLQLAENNLSGSIPAELGKLTNLVSLACTTTIWRVRYPGRLVDLPSCRIFPCTGTS